MTDADDKYSACLQKEIKLYDIFVPLVVRIFFPCCHTVVHLKIAASVTIIFTCKKYEFYYNKRKVSGSVWEKRECYCTYPEY